VLALVPVDDETDALALAGRCPYALGASVFGPPRPARDLAARVRAGVVQVNDLIVPTADPRLPFGGGRDSGFGRTRGAEGLIEMTTAKVITTRGGGFRPHFDPLSESDAPTVLAYLRAAHGRTAAGRIAAAVRLLVGLVRQGRRGNASSGAGNAPIRPASSASVRFTRPDLEIARGNGGVASMKRTETGRVGVIGGGLGGLAAACTLAARGYEVLLLEKNEWLGGKAAVHEADGFRFDMGPTILLMPSVLGRILAEAGRDLRDELDLVPLDPQWRAFFADGATLDLHADGQRMGGALEAFAPGRGLGRGYGRFMDLSARLSEISDRFFFWRSVGSPLDMIDLRASLKPGMLGEWLGMRPWSTVARTVRSFVPEPRVAQMLDHLTQYVGSAPDASPAVLCGIARMQAGEGVWYPRGGTRAIPEMLARLAEGLGVAVRTGTGVRSIVRDAAGGIAGVVTDEGEEIPLDALVCNADAVRAHRELLDDAPAARFARRRRYEPACSGVVLYLGLDRRYDHLLHHNFAFSRDPEREFDAIYRRGEPADDPTCYVCAPARTDPDVAPPGGEALYILVHTPYLRPHHDWDRLFPPYRRTILETLARTAGLHDLERHIRYEARLTPADIHRRYGVLDGAIYGLASHGRLRGAFKPANRSPDVARLYLAGGSAHPGPGMPMVLMSGWIAADALDRDGLVPRTHAGRDALSGRVQS
jgi:phytoene desaturase